MKRLSVDTCRLLSNAVLRPDYDRTTLRPGILHLGVGAFHRAHQAVYTDTALQRSGGDWGIIGVSLRSDSVAQQLNPQDGLYTVHSEDADGEQTRLVGSVLEVLVAPQAAAAVDAWMAEPSIRIITLTITEKGYCLGADGWSLDLANAQIVQDMQAPGAARSAIGVLARGLLQRFNHGAAPLSIVSCDNLTENSARLRQVLRQYLQACHPHILPWLDESVAFPCSMVDRIVPATSASRLSEQARLLGLRDEAAIVTEPFTQWIIENSFATEIPDWPCAGAQLVADVRPFEAAKLRLLNASHSAIAYLGLLLEKDTVADFMAEHALKQFVQRLMSANLMPALRVPSDFDLGHYAEQLQRRFENPRLHHRCAQIAMDGSEKIRQRWVETLETLPGDSLLLRALAGWCYLVLATDIELDDPRRGELLALRRNTAPLGQRLRELLRCINIDRADDPDWQERLACLERHYASIADGGIRSLLTLPAPGRPNA
ncbi:MAG: mannitol dehydrogenase [Haliea sp.]|uniref:mannitol dehydrogenase family protein n=1 Tax=Haliea sp. TaxID=1932666 RepID=UPI000C670B13|nr:mannitol dehydrogenase family protein [Haliea sp.]MBM70471.1 mannitol dehydrogenase [Haliea sp.]